MKNNIDYTKTSHEPLLSLLIKACLEPEEDSRPHAFEMINYLNQLEEEYYGRIVSDEKEDNTISLHASSLGSTVSPNTSGSYSQSMDHSFSSGNHSFDYSLDKSGSAVSDKRSVFSNSKKNQKLSCKSKEFVKPSNLDTPKKIFKPSSSVDTKQSSVQSATQSEKGSSNKPTPAMNELTPHKGVTGKSKFIAEERYEDDSPRHKEGGKLDSSSKPKIFEETLGVADENNFIGFQPFNQSQIEDDQSFIDSSFNTILNLNEELADEQLNDNKKLLQQDFKGELTPEGYLKLNILVPYKGELI